MRKLLFFGASILLLCFATACSKHNDITADLSAGNRWILDSMRMYYYWSDQIPASPNPQNSAGTFFTGLLSGNDRFSYMTDPADPATDYSSFSWYGFEYAIVQIQNRAVGVITLVVPASPAAKKGLKRGDYFISVNNISVAPENIANIHRILVKGDGALLQMAKESSGSFINTVSASLTHSYFTQQPVYCSKVFSKGADKAGYLFYNAFDGQFDKLLMDSITKLKNAGITSLIIDLRYNPGGDVSSAAKLAAILSNADKNAPFITYEANKNGGKFVSSVEDAIEENTYAPASYSALQPYRLTTNKVVLLTSRSTASAAEVLVNCLKPYMQVIQVGDTTLGKDMGSFAIADQHTPKQVDYTLYPLIFKLYNALGNGNYSKGIPPDFYINELSTLPLLPIGSLEDPLLQKALALTIGLPAVATAGTSSRGLNARQVLYQSSSAQHQQHIIVSKRHWKK